MPYGSLSLEHLPNVSAKKVIPKIANIKIISKITIITSTNGPNASNKAPKINFKLSLWLTNLNDLNTLNNRRIWKKQQRTVKIIIKLQNLLIRQIYIRRKHID